MRMRSFIYTTGSLSTLPISLGEKQSIVVSAYIFKNQTKCVSCSELFKESEQMHLKCEVASFISLIVSKSWLKYQWSFPEPFMRLYEDYGIRARYCSFITFNLLVLSAHIIIIIIILISSL